MELRGMVVVNGMAQLVDNDEIAQMLRKRHQEKAQRNVVRPGTAPPLRTRGTDRQLVVLQPRDAGEPTDTVGQVGFGGAPQLFDAGFFRGRRQLRRAGKGDYPLPSELENAANELLTYSDEELLILFFSMSIERRDSALRLDDVDISAIMAR